jgi:Linear amide C-N hydrolases, choloylglycine hydrolase family
LHTGLWAQYLLDQAATVDEALALVKSTQLVMIAAHGFDATLHLAVEDEGGDSAIIELTAYGPVIHHGREFTLMTNDPTYDEQLRLLASKDFSHPSRDLALPGNVNAVDRFQRAAYYSALLPEPADQRQAVRAYWPSCATSRCRSARATVNSGCTTPNTARCVTSPIGCTSSSSRPARARFGCDGRARSVRRCEAARRRPVRPVVDRRRHRPVRAKRHRFLTATGISRAYFVC